MAKKKVTRRVKRSKEPTMEQLEDSKSLLLKQTSSFLMETLSESRHEYGDVNIAAAGEAGRIVIGIPLPCLALEYLFQNNVFPLGRMVQVVGTEGTCKSAFCFEIARWFRGCAGVGYLFENETKYSPDFAMSIIGYPKHAGDESLGHIPCSSIEDWQSKIQNIVGKCQKKMGDPVIGRKFPVLLILDSIMGKLSEESQNKISKDGYADRSFPVEALKINSWLKKFPQDIEEWPMTFVATNHLKPQKAEGGHHMERHKAGGRSISFQETLEIELKRSGNANIRLVDESEDGGLEIGGLRLKIACKKNSLGETNRDILVEIKWTHKEDPETGELRQYTIWDWPAATVYLLASFDKGTRRDKIREVVDVGGSGNRWYSKKYGINSAEPVSAHELGLLIEADEEVKHSLRRLFGVKSRKIFLPGVDYLEQLKSLREAATVAMTNPQEFELEDVPEAEEFDDE